MAKKQKALEVTKKMLQESYANLDSIVGIEDSSVNDKMDIGEYEKHFAKTIYELQLTEEEIEQLKPKTQEVVSYLKEKYPASVFEEDEEEAEEEDEEEAEEEAEEEEEEAEEEEEKPASKKSAKKEEPKKPEKPAGKKTSKKVKEEEEEEEEEEKPAPKKAEKPGKQAKKEEPAKEKPAPKKAEKPAKEKAPKREGPSLTTLRIEFYKPLIEKAKFTKAELIEKGLAHFPEQNKSALQTFLCDSKNPKYNKFNQLVVEDATTKIMSFQTPKKAKK